MTTKTQWFNAASACAALAVLAACGGDNGGDATVNSKPSFVVGAINSMSYTGTTDDLLTGGAGKTGLASATPPAVADPRQSDRG